MTARGEQLDAIRVASQGQNIALLQLIPTPSAGLAEHKGRVGICLHLLLVDMYCTNLSINPIPIILHRSPHVTIFCPMPVPSEHPNFGCRKKGKSASVA